MKLLAGLFGRKAKAEKTKDADFNLSAAKDNFDRVEKLKLDDVAHAVPEPVPAPAASPAPAAKRMAKANAAAEDIDTDLLNRAAEEARPAVNIWDLDDENAPAGAAAEAAPAVAAPDRATSRARRNRTRLIGFDKSGGDVVDLFDEEAAAAKKAETTAVQFPVGWLLVVKGPGRGHCFPLVAGMSQIGRGEDQAVRLDFGDSAISRQNHAAIVYDSDNRKFMLGHGGKANIVRLNNQPVISNEAMVDTDQIKIGDTVLQLKTLCGDSFDWSDTAGDEEREDVAIA